MNKKWFFEGTNAEEAFLSYFLDGAQNYARRIRADPHLSKVVEEIYVCGSAGRFNVTPNDIDILVFGKGITETDRKTLFKLRMEEDKNIQKELEKNLPAYTADKHHGRPIIDLEINNLKKLDFVKKNDPTSLNEV